MARQARRNSERKFRLLRVAMLFTAPGPALFLVVLAIGLPAGAARVSLAA